MSKTSSMLAHFVKIRQYNGLLCRRGKLWRPLSLLFESVEFLNVQYIWCHLILQHIVYRATIRKELGKTAPSRDNFNGGSAWTHNGRCWENHPWTRNIPWTVFIVPSIPLHSVHRQRSFRRWWANVLRTAPTEFWKPRRVDRRRVGACADF